MMTSWRRGYWNLWCIFFLLKFSFLLFTKFSKCKVKITSFFMRIECWIWDTVYFYALQEENEAGLHFDFELSSGKTWQCFSRDLRFKPSVWKKLKHQNFVMLTIWCNIYEFWRRGENYTKERQPIKGQCRVNRVM